MDWNLATWDGSRRGALRRWAQLPLERIIAALEEMQELSDHGHAFYLPDDSDGDGRIDRLTVHVPGGIDQECHRVLVRLTRLGTHDQRA